MKRVIIILIMIFGNIFPNYSQDVVGGGVMSFDLPAKNSLKFNKFLINPTFSFVKEDESFLSIYGKRQFLGIDEATQSLFASYSGKLGENNGIAIGLFQKNYGVLTSFGGVGNFTRSIELSRDNYLSFGLNIGFINSGINTGNVKTNSVDPAIQNIPKNSLVSINPGINYGIGFLDFGVVANNIFFYNFSGSGLVSDDPTKSIGGHIMYTGYLSSSSSQSSKFSALIKGEVAKENTVLAANLLYNSPNLGWIQASYNTINGASAGLGFILAKKISFGYTAEIGLGEFSKLGLSHEVTLAYKIRGYGDYEDVKPVVASSKTKPVVKKKTAAEIQKEKDAAEAKRLAQLEAERLKKEKEAAAKAEADRKAQEEAEGLRKETEAAAKAEADRKAQEESERLRKETEAAAKAEAERKTQEESERLRKEKEAAAKAEADRKAQEESERLRKEKEAAAKAEADRKAEEEAERLRKEKEAVAKAEADRKAEEEAERLRKEKEAAAKTEADRKAQEEAAIAASKKTIEDKQLEFLSQVIKDSKKNQESSLSKLDSIAKAKKKELDEMKRINDLSDQGIQSEPKTFQSSVGVNKTIESLKNEIAENIKEQDKFIAEFEKLYNDRLKNGASKNDELSQIYVAEINKFKKEKEESIKQNQSLIDKLEQIKADIDIEKKRRIKLATFDSGQARYDKDRELLNNIKRNTTKTGDVFTAADFDYGNELSGTKIIKNIGKAEKGYYLVLAVHKDVKKRDEFVKKAIQAGETNIDFFYNENDGSYYIYNNKYLYIDEASKASESKGSKPYNSKMGIVKVE